MSVFSAALATIHNDPNMAAEAIYVPVMTAVPVTIRAVRTAPDEEARYGDARMRVDSTTFDIRMADIAEPQAGDVLEFEGVTYVVQGAPERDAERLSWTVEAVPR